MNVVSGWFKAEFTSIGQWWLDHGERYRRSNEFIRCLKGIWTEEKFNFKGDGIVLIDGNTVSNADAPADLTMTISLDNFIALGEGTLDPMTAVMTGKLKLSDLGAAMALQGKIQALFSRLQQ